MVNLPSWPSNRRKGFAVQGTYAVIDNAFAGVRVCRIQRVFQSRSLDILALYFACKRRAFVWLRLPGCDAVAEVIAANNGVLVWLIRDRQFAVD